MENEMSILRMHDDFIILNTQKEQITIDIRGTA